MIRNTLFAGALALLFTTGAEAAQLRYSDPLPGHLEITSADLIRQLVPDLAPDINGYARGRQMAPLRHVMEGEGGEPPVDIEVFSADVVPFRADGRTLTLLFSVLGRSGDRIAETALLALYDENLRLIDAVDVGIYEHHQFGSLTQISQADDAVRINSEHFNSNQGYDAAELIFVRDGKLTLIDTIYTFSVETGSYEERQSLSFEAEDDGQPGFWPITASVHATRTVKPPEPLEEGEEAPEPAPPYDRMITQTYNWSASLGGYVADSDALEKLNAENEDKY